METVVQAMENSTVKLMPKRIKIDNAEWIESIGKSYDKNMAMGYPGIQHDFNFYFVTCVLTLTLVAVLILIYSYFCVWVLKGNLDLPIPGGPEPSKYKIWWTNPCKRPFNRISVKIKNLLGVNVPPETELENVADAPGITTITSTVKKSSEETTRRRSLFEKTPSMVDGFKQFSQFRYDLHEEEPEEVVFDVYDLQT